MKTYVITVSEKFPDYHYRSGEPTNFVSLIKSGTKIHTIRKNYAHWERRVKEIDSGGAILSIRTWQGMPYRSKQTTHLELNYMNYVGIEQITFHKNMQTCDINGKEYPAELIAKNDGVTQRELGEWFRRGYDRAEPMALIHFTPFRYNDTWDTL